MRLFSSETSNEIDALPSERTFRKLLWGAILWPAGTLCVVVALLVVLVLHLYRAAGWLDHSDQVISQVWTTEKMAVDMETGLRAYQLTNAPVFLKPWNEAESRIGGSFDSLAGLVADNPSQSMATTESRELFERWRSFATETLNRMKSGGDIRSAEWNARGKGLFDAFRERMDRFVETEEQLRMARERSYEELRRAVMSALIAAGLIGAPFLAWRFRSLFRGISDPFRTALATAHAQRSELRVTLRSIGDAVLATDAEGAVVFLNPVAEKLTGWREEEARGKPFEAVLPLINEKTGEQAGNPIERVLREGVVVGLANHTVLRRRDGSEIAIEDSAAPIFSADGSLRGVILVFHDVSELRVRSQALERALEEAAEQAARFRFLADSNSLHVWTARADGQLDWVNANAARYFGVNDLEKEILGAAWGQFVHPEDLPNVLARWSKSVATGERYEAEFRLRSAEGEYRWFLVRAEATRDDTGAVTKWIGSNTDTDGLKTAQRTAEAASRAKDDFLAALSHELRTPLTPVLMAAAAWSEESRLPEEARADLGMIARNIGLEARLIDDLLDLTRISRGKLRIRETDCETHSLIGHVVGILRDEAQSKSVAVELQLDAQRSSVRGDPTRLQQVFWNLLRNAIKFTPSGGRVIVRTKDSEGAQLCIEIRDTGIGLPSEKIETIFRAFEQAWPENEHQFGGLGLGLAIAKAIVDLHGGEIHAESEGPGKGATFVVHLPSAAEGGASIAGGTGEARQNGDAAETEHRSLRLLVVEDHEPTLTVLSRLLTKAGHQVSAASSVATACSLAEGGEFDVFITDIGLPDGTGLEALNAIRKLHPGLPGIALSGYGMEEDLKHSMDAGFSAHLIKPVDFDQLQHALREVSASRGVALYSAHMAREMSRR